MDEVNETALRLIGKALNDANILETSIIDIRQEFGSQLHPWSLLPLANAIGSIQAFQSHLRAAKYQIEKRADTTAVEATPEK